MLSTDGFAFAPGKVRLLNAAAFLLALIFAFAPLVALAQTFPALTGRVVDAAGLLDSTEQSALEDKLRDYEIETTNQVVVVTVLSLGGITIDDYANRLFNRWGIGQKEKNNGVLLLVAPKERRVRIEVGYGLEQLLTNARSKLVLERRVTPLFRKNNYAGGIGAGIDAIISILSGDTNDFDE